MASLQQLLTQSVQQNLGLADVIDRRRQEAQRFGQAQVQISGLQAREKIRVDEQAKREREERENKDKGFFGTLGTILGAVGGFALAGPAGLAAQFGAAQTGASVGGTAARLISGGTDVGQTEAEKLLTTGLSLGSQTLSAIDAAKPKEEDISKFFVRQVAVNPETNRPEISFIPNPLGLSKGFSDPIFTGLSPKTDELASVERKKLLFNQVENLQKKPLFLAASKQLSAAKNVRNLVKLARTGNETAIGALRTQIPRLEGEVGNLAAGEQNNAIGGVSIKRFYDDTVSRLTKGKLSDATLDDLDQILDVFESAGTSNINELIQLSKGSLGILGFDDDTIRKAFEPALITNAFSSRDIPNAGSAQAPDRGTKFRKYKLLK